MYFFSYFLQSNALFYLLPRFSALFFPVELTQFGFLLCVCFLSLPLQLSSAGDHGSTFAGGPLVCAAACATFDRIAASGFLVRVSDMGNHLVARLKESQTRLEALRATAVASDPAERGNVP